jgi:3-deoxy-7-phosphoheptulonate synthase
MARASVAAGADAIMVEVHPEPAKATSDGAQTINFAEFARMMSDLARRGAGDGTGYLIRTFMKTASPSSAWA